MRGNKKMSSNNLSSVNGVLTDTNNENKYLIIDIGTLYGEVIYYNILGIMDSNDNTVKMINYDFKNTLEVPHNKRDMLLLSCDSILSEGLHYVDDYIMLRILGKAIKGYYNENCISLETNGVFRVSLKRKLDSLQLRYNITNKEDKVEVKC